MAAIFINPLQFPFAAIGGTALTTNPAKNLLMEYASMVWQSNVASTNITLAVGKPVDTIALWGTNQAASDTVRIRLGPNSAGTSPVYDVTVPGSANIIHQIPTTYTAAYLRLDFTRASGITYNEASHLVVGTRIVCDGIKTGSERTFDDQSIIGRGPNWQTTDIYPGLVNWKVTVEGIMPPEYFTQWQPFIQRVGEARAFVFMPDTDSAYASFLNILGKMTSPPKVTSVTGVDHVIDMTIGSIV